MQRFVNPLVFLALLLAACAPEAAGLPTSTQQDSPPDMLDLQIGEALPGVERLDTGSSPGGIVIVDLPMPAGPLSEIFHDYSVQVDPTTKKVISASARRTFASFPECQTRFDTLASALKGKYRFDTKSATGPASLEGTVGPVSFELLCSLRGGSDYPTLSLALFNKSLAAQAYERGRQRDGR